MPIINPDGQNSVEYDYTPDICPQCHHALHPKVLTSTLNGDSATLPNIFLEIAYKCTHRSCQSMFIGQYKRYQQHSSGQMGGVFRLEKCVPLKYIAPEIFPEVEEISPGFKNIYEQAYAAEAAQLDEISGVGYRKALEFLIKDYCIYKNPENKEEIKSAFLGVVINKFVEDANLKACAQRAAWLGNDETHYVRKWENKDINDLKALINLSCVWVRSNILTEKYLSEME